MSMIVCPKCGCKFDTNEALTEHLRKVLSSTVDPKHKRKKQTMSLVPAM